jgi:PhoH-like ATPase
MPQNDHIYVLDTSVLIHDPDCLSGFHNTSVAVPIFCIMELDDLKDGKRYDVASSARAASRRISDLRELGSLNDPRGVFDPDTGTTYYVASSQKGSGIEALKATGSTRHMDLLILETALAVQTQHADKKTVLITKDINLRILADAEGLVAEDYERDKVHISDMYRGRRCVADFDMEKVASAYYPNADALIPADMGLGDLKPNEFVVFDNGSVQHLFRNVSGVLKVVPKDFRGVDITPRNLEQRAALDLLMDPEIQLVTMLGKAGTGKTFLALAAALAQMDAGGLFKSLLLSKPTLAMGHSDVGFLPGTLEEKMEPWMQSFFDNFDQIITTPNNQGRKGGEKNWEYLFHSGVVKLQTIHTIRGRSIPNALMFIDEAQNLTPHEVKTIITRAAVGTKVILSGDPFQCDSRFLDQHSNGLTYVTERMKDQPRFGTVFIQSGVRSELSDLAATLL